MYLSDPNIEEIIRAVKEMDSNEKKILIMIGEHSKLDVQELIVSLNAEKINYYGGIFPGVIYNEEQSDRGVVLSDLPVMEGPYLIQGLESGNIQLPDFKELEEVTAKKPTALVLVDGLAGNISVFLARLFSKLARTVTYIGGGAGSLTLQQKPCLFTPEGLFKDAALVTFLNLECSLGVRHGWESIMGPLIATSTNKNRIYELNWKNAYDVYRNVVEDNSGKKLNKNNFFDLAKGYPFGMIKEYHEHIVRDPIAVGEDGELICVGEVPENSVLDILKGVDTSLIEAAGQAAADCLPAREGNITHCLVADCISRVLFLEEKFSSELKAVKQQLLAIDQTLVPVGMLTLGEISSYGEGYLEFFNKTIVVGTFYER